MQLHIYSLPTAPTPCAYLTQLHVLYLDAGKGHQVMKNIQLRAVPIILFFYLLFYSEFLPKCSY